MSDRNDKIQQASGAFKKATGKIAGDEEREAEGEVEQRVGEAREKLSDLADKARGAAGELREQGKKHLGKHGE